MPGYKSGIAFDATHVPAPPPGQPESRTQLAADRERRDAESQEHKTRKNTTEPSPLSHTARNHSDSVALNKSVGRNIVNKVKADWTPESMGVGVVLAMVLMYLWKR